MAPMAIIAIAPPICMLWVLPVSALGDAHDAGAPLGRERDVPSELALGRRALGPQSGALDDAADDLAHLGLRERRAQAAPGPAAERQPRVARRGVVAEPALGPEGERVGMVAGSRPTSPIAGATCVPAGMRWPPISVSRVVRRPTRSITGRTRSTSLTTASR
jgi:hypothetical protein